MTQNCSICSILGKMPSLKAIPRSYGPFKIDIIACNSDECLKELKDLVFAASVAVETTPNKKQNGKEYDDYEQVKKVSHAMVKSLSVIGKMEYPDKLTLAKTCFGLILKNQTSEKVNNEESGTDHSKVPCHICSATKKVKKCDACSKPTCMGKDCMTDGDDYYGRPGAYYCKYCKTDDSKESCHVCGTMEKVTKCDACSKPTCMGKNCMTGGKDDYYGRPNAYYCKDCA
jgi:hypothetical protein